jgi:hypothetical protein
MQARRGFSLKSEGLFPWLSRGVEFGKTEVICFEQRARGLHIIDALDTFVEMIYGVCTCR